MCPKRQAHGRGHHDEQPRVEAMKSQNATAETGATAAELAVGQGEEVELHQEVVDLLADLVIESLFGTGDSP